MKQQQSGFTLIELIAVIVILGIIAAVAVPRFVDLSGAASQAAVNGVASSLTSASALNFAASTAGQAGLDTTLTATAVANCGDVEPLLEGGSLPTGYSISGADLDSCVVEGPNEDTAPFTAIAADEYPAP